MRDPLTEHLGRSIVGAVIERARCRPTTPHHDPSGRVVCRPSANQAQHGAPRQNPHRTLVTGHSDYYAGLLGVSSHLPEWRARKAGAARSGSGPGRARRRAEGNRSDGSPAPPARSHASAPGMSRPGRAASAAPLLAPTTPGRCHDHRPGGYEPGRQFPRTGRRSAGTARPARRPAAHPGPRRALRPAARRCALITVTGGRYRITACCWQWRAGYSSRKCCCIC